ncbi:MAG: hypothetical protein MUC79_16285 [Thiobacillaceae bacterium]|jgi:hypothetical protein|nr:hypothetical protein [Thiobacillaceae bacterium]
MDNYLALGGLIRERLRPLTEQWPTLSVLSARDLVGVRLAEERLPAVHVLYMGDRMRDEIAHHGRLQVVDQVWGIIVSHRDLRDTSEAIDSVGGMISAVLAQLQGWQPPGVNADGTLRRVQAPDPMYQNGVLRVPLYFQARALSRGVSS